MTLKVSIIGASGYTGGELLRLLLFHPEVELAQVLRDYLEKAGFRVLLATSGPAAVSTFRHSPADLVILDLNLPGLDGLDVARELRRTSHVPIIMATARVEESDRLVGLELGADDYVIKPYSPREVVARVRAVLRRSQGAPTPPDVLRARDVAIDRVRHQVTVGEKNVELTPMLEAAQGDAFEGYERTIDAHIKNLRAKLEPDPRQPRYVLTVFGIGYRFAGE